MVLLYNRFISCQWDTQLIHRHLFPALFFLITVLPAGGMDTATAGVGTRAPADTVTFFLLPTARGETREMYTIAGGRFGAPFTLVYGAVLVARGKDVFLFDTGLGRRVDKQFEENMPWWAAPFFEYKKGRPLALWFETDSSLPRPGRIFLSHGHWDHASGLPDFPTLPVWLPRAEYDFIHNEGPPAVFPSQFIRPDSLWHIYPFEDKLYAGFEQSLDLYGDGSVVLVLMGGHTPGSVGMFINMADGRRYLFPGDLVWNRDQIENQRGKFWLSRMLADYDGDRVEEVIRKMRALQLQDPGLRIIPAHDERAWNEILREH